MAPPSTLWQAIMWGKGLVGCGHITVIGNVAPAVAITNPVSNASFASGSSIVINATATDNDGSVTNVAFYAGVSLLGQRTSSPYSFTWTNVVAGNYTLTAVAATWRPALDLRSR